MATKTILIQTIRIDGATQSRVRINDDTVSDYADAMKAGAKFPPPVVFHDGTDYWLADGFHRVMAYQRLQKKSIAAEVRKGTRRDAQFHSVGANANHGLRRSNEDKRKCVMMLLQDAEWGKWSNNRIAEAAGVSHTLVNELRAQLEESSSQGTRTGRDGIERKVPSKAPSRPIPTPLRPVSGKPAPTQTSKAPPERPAKVEYPEVTAALEAVPQFRELVNKVHAINREIRELAADKIGTHIRAQQCETDLRNVVKAIEFATPFKACPQMPNCKNGCKVCSGACFVTKEIWDRIPEDERA